MFLVQISSFRSAISTPNSDVLPRCQYLFCSRGRGTQLSLNWWVMTPFASWFNAGVSDPLDDVIIPRYAISFESFFHKRKMLVPLTRENIGYAESYQQKTWSAETRRGTHIYVIYATGRVEQQNFFQFNKLINFNFFCKSFWRPFGENTQKMYF